MGHTPPYIQPPSREEIRESASEHYIELTDKEVTDFVEVIPEILATFERLDELVPSRRERSYMERDSGYRPGEAEDPHNAFVTKCNIHSSTEGALEGYRVGLKDNIAVAGVEMTAGSKLLDGYVPTEDATIVPRLLDAGASIVGKTNMSDMAFYDNFSATGAMLNPRDTAFYAGASSGGSAIAIVTGDIDIGIGTDQGGSIRMPASWCGIVGLKPTFGLVPYTGIMGLGHTFDHVGPMAASVNDCALTLDALTGWDPLDPRMDRSVTPKPYAESLDETLDDITVAAVPEGFGHRSSQAAVDETVRNALSAFAAENEAVSKATVEVPWHRDGMAVANGVSTEETAALFRSEGVGHFNKGFYDTQFATAFAKARRTRGDDLPPTVKLRLIVGEYLADEYLGYYHAKAQNLRRDLTGAYDEALSNADVLAMPTTPMTAHPVDEGLTRREILDRAPGRVRNLAPFNVTGHPAISLPCGTVDGLPIGLMLVGRLFDDETVLRVAHAFETIIDWETF